MDLTKQVEKFRDFMEANYVTEIHTLIQKGAKSLIIDFKLIAEFDPELSELLIAEPEEVIKAAELALEQFEITKKSTLDRIRIKNLPISQTIKIGEIRSKDLGRFISAEGIVRQSSDVRPQVTYAKFECAACGNTISIPQLDSKFKEPSRCTCGMRGRFRLLSKILIDAQHLKIEEIPEKLEGGEQPKRLSVFLKEDLVEPHMERKCSPGAKVIINGIVKEVPVQLKTGAQSIRYDIILEANYIEPLEEDFSQIEIKEEEIQDILAFSKRKDAFELLSKAIAPSISGHEKIKEALVLQMLGGCRVVKPDKTTRRGDIHMLLCGDPGSGKSVILQFISKAAPKARFISGKGASGAGITASVVKDEFLKGWSLEAGALVLANKGIAVVDELDKMSHEDRSALHEALEQQSYHKDFEIMFGDGTTEKIGEFVDQCMEENKEKIIKGKDCEILLIKSFDVLTTDFENIYPVKIDRISRHKAPDYFVEVEFSNGRCVLVTPEHPFFVFDKSKYIEISAEKLEEGMNIPAPRRLPCHKKKSLLKSIALNVMNKKINLPQHVDGEFARLLGYVASEGHTYYDKNNSYAEIGISNTNKNIVHEVSNLFNKIFMCHINHNIAETSNRLKATKDLHTIRCCSVPLYRYFKENFYGFTFKAPQKFIPNNIRQLNNEFILQFLKSSFKGDGFVDSERFGYSTSSYKLAKGYSDLLLMNSIWNYIAKEEREDASYYKVVISGNESLKKFFDLVVESDDSRYGKILNFCQRSSRKANDRDVLPIANEVNQLLKELRLSDGYFVNNIKNNQSVHVKTIGRYLNKIAERLNDIVDTKDYWILRQKLNITIKEIADNLGCSYQTIYNLKRKNDLVLSNIVKEFSINKIKLCKEKLARLKKLINSEIRLVKVKSVRKIKNLDSKLVYDVTVEPNHTFISEGLVLHNTITISKANIQATLRAETTLLAAANPKLGRFDPYSPIAAQIDLPSTLINRFDLIFPVRDIPSKEKDEKIAMHVLISNIDSTIFETEVTQEFLKKYIAYAKTRIKPELTKAAINEIKNFYVTLRNSGQAGEAGIKPIPISARQLEGLIRLSEASAKSRLSDKVTREDSQRAISLMKHCLTEVGIDPETGQIDIDRISTGISASKRGKIITIKDIINILTAKGMELIPIEEIIAAAAEKGIEESVVEETIEKLKRDGDLAEIKKGHVTKI